MAFSQTDLDNIDAAIVLIATSGAQTVRFSDGREVTYYSISDLMKARAAITEIARGGTRCTFASFTKD